MLRPPLALRARLVALLCLNLAGCAGVQVSTDYEPGADHSRYRSYAWLPDPAPSELVDEFVIERLHQAIDAALAEKGLERVEDARQDSLRVGYTVRLRDRAEVREPYSTFGRVRVYEEGTLILDLVDADQDRLVWRGTGVTEIQPTDSPEEHQERVEKVVRAILDEYPPGS